MAKTWRERVADAETPKYRVFGFTFGQVGFTGSDHDAWVGLESCCVGEYAQGVAEALDIHFIEAWQRVNGRRDNLDLSFAAHQAIFIDKKPRQLSRVLDVIEARALQLKREGIA